MSKKIRVVFYKAKTGDGHWLDNAINTWTWLISAKNRKVGPYSHVEIWTPEITDNGIELFVYHEVKHNDKTLEDKPFKELRGTCWTSTMRGENNGTVSRPANTVIENAERWDYAEIEVSDYKYKHILYRMKNLVAGNEGYAKWDILKFISPIHFPDNTRNICSEFCNNVLSSLVLEGFGIVSPRRLAWKLKQAGYEIKPLKEIE